MTINITPKAVEQLAAYHESRGSMLVAETLYALSAANEDAYLRGFAAGTKVPNAGEFTVVDSPDLVSLRASLTRSQRILMLIRIVDSLEVHK